MSARALKQPLIAKEGEPLLNVSFRVLRSVSGESIFSAKVNNYSKMLSLSEVRKQAFLYGRVLKILLFYYKNKNKVFSMYLENSCTISISSPSVSELKKNNN